MIAEIIKKGIIEPSELHKLLGSQEKRDGVKILDCSYVLPNSPENPYQNYLKHRIDHAAFFDIDEIADHDSDLPHMLPGAESFEIMVSKLGISNDDLIVTYGQAGMLMAPARAWWMFRAFGHNNICVLNGGLPAWIQEGFEVNTGLPTPYAPASFTAKFQKNLVCNLQDVEDALKNQSALIIDARPKERFEGLAPEPRPEIRSGHIRDSVNIPTTEFVTPESGQLKSATDLQAVFENIGYKRGDSVIATCGSGATACNIALALHSLGHTNVSVYDGSWSEWYTEKVEKKVSAP